jgi:hypothetical protein
MIYPTCTQQVYMGKRYIYIHTTLILMVFGKIKLHKQRTQACRKGKMK